MPETYVAFTPREGVWAWTESETPEEAIDKLYRAIIWKQVLSSPIDNPISFRVLACVPSVSRG